MDDRSLLATYLEVIGVAGNGRGQDLAELRRGQFHDVVLHGDVAYRFPRDEESRRLLPQRVALLGVLAGRGLPVAIPRVLSDAAMNLPLRRCHAALGRIPGRPGDYPRGAAPAGNAVIGRRRGEPDRRSRLLPRILRQWLGKFPI